METFFRTLGLFIFAFVCFRLMGFRSIGDMEPFDFVIVLAIAEIVGAPLVDLNLPVLPAIIAITTLTGVQFLLSYLSLKSKKFRNIIEGQPIPVIINGKVIKKNMAKARFNYSDLAEELRVKGIKNTSDVELASLEPSGRLSLIKKKEIEPITPRYLGKRTSVTLIEDGRINHQAFINNNIPLDFLDNRLKMMGISSPKLVELAVLDPSNHLIITKKRPDLPDQI